MYFYTQILQYNYIVTHSGNALYNSSLLARGKFVGNMMLNLTSRSPFCPGDFDKGMPSLEIL